MEKGNDGQARGDGTGAVNSGQKTLRHPADLGKAAVPASAADADINTQTGVERNANDPARRR